MNVKQYAFVTAYLKHRDAIIAYKLATGSESTNLRSLQSAANRMLNKPGVREEIESVLKATRAEVEAEIAETTRTELMTIQRKREILAQIINGQYTVMVRTKGKNCNPCTYFNSPTISQVLAGIREDNKMAGHYAITTTAKQKTQHPSRSKREITTTQVCPPLAAVSRSDGSACLSGRQGILEQEDEMQQSATTISPEEASCGGCSPRPNGAAGRASGGRGTLAPEEKPTTSHNRALSPSAAEAPANADPTSCLILPSCKSRFRHKSPLPFNKLNSPKKRTLQRLKVNLICS